MRSKPRFSFSTLSTTHPCDSSNKLWYSKGLRILIYSKGSINVPSDANLLASFDSLIGTPTKNIVDKTKSLITTPPGDNSFTKPFKRFDSLYFNQIGSRSATSIKEGIGYKNAVVEYKNINNNICQYTDKVNEEMKDAFSGIACKNDGSSFYVLAQGDKLTSFNPDEMWPDLTAKIRLK